MLTLTNTPSADESTPAATPPKALPAPANPLRLALGSSGEAAQQVSHAIDQAQRRLDNLRDLIDRFDLEDDDGPRAA